MLGRLMNVLRGFFAQFVTGVEKRNPEALLELEQENLRKQIGSYNQSLAVHAGLAERLIGQVRKLETEENELRARTTAHLRAGNKEAAAQHALRLQTVTRELAAIVAGECRLSQPPSRPLPCSSLLPLFRMPPIALADRSRAAKPAYALAKKCWLCIISGGFFRSSFTMQTRRLSLEGESPTQVARMPSARIFSSQNLPRSSDNKRGEAPAWHSD